MKRFILAALLLASCGQSGSPDLQISDAWARQTVAGQTATAAYFKIENLGPADDRLVSIAAPAPAAASLHTTESSNGIARMRELSAGLTIPSGSTIELKPSGTHVMITGLAAPLKPGDTLKLALRFETSGDRDLDVTVTPATGPEGH